MARLTAAPSKKAPDKLRRVHCACSWRGSTEYTASSSLVCLHTTTIMTYICDDVTLMSQTNGSCCSTIMCCCRVVHTLLTTVTLMSQTYESCCSKHMSRVAALSSATYDSQVIQIHGSCHVNASWHVSESCHVNAPCQMNEP